MSSAAEKFHASNTLSFVVGLCVGKVTTVELKNDCFVTGRVTEVDGYMNVHLREAVHVDATGASRDLSDYYVPNRLIRWVQIPTEIDIKESIKSKFDPQYRMDQARSRGFGVSRGRQKIMSSRERRRQEDVANAIRLKEEMVEAKAQRESK